MRTKKLSVLLGALLLVASACDDPLPTAPPQVVDSSRSAVTVGDVSYELVTLAALPGISKTWAYGINDNDEIIGQSDDSNVRIVTWVNGAIQDRGEGRPLGINNFGTLFGFVPFAGSVFVQEGTANTLLDFDGFASGYELINDGGTVTAGDRVWEIVADGYGAPSLLGLPAACDGPTGAYHCEAPSSSAINGDGDIAGDFFYGSDTGGYSVAGVWATDNYADPIILGPSGQGRRVNGMNDAGWIVGSVGGSAAIWIPLGTGYGAPILLPALDSGAGGTAYAVTEPDAQSVVRVVGHSDSRAALWIVDAGGSASAPVDLGKPGGKFNGGVWARAINENGLIVGDARSNREHVAILWQPSEAGGGDDGGGDDDSGDDGGECTHPRGKCK